MSGLELLVLLCLTLVATPIYTTARAASPSAVPDGSPDISLSVTSPAANTVIHCEPGSLEAVVKLGVSADISSLGQHRMEELEVEIVVDPHLWRTTKFAGTVPLSDLSMAQIVIGHLLPGERVIRVQVIEANSHVSYAETSITFFVQCGDDSFDTTGVLSTYDSSDLDRAQYFQNVYKYNMWSSDESESGPGSTKAAAVNVSVLIADLLEGHSAVAPRPTHIFDIPCGDLHWMAALLPLMKLHGVPYTGMDVSSDVIVRNSQKYGSEESTSLVNFAYLDVVSDALPAMPAGALVVCRHLMLHLSISDNLKALYRLVSSPAHWLLLTTFHNDVDERSDNDVVFPLFLGHRINLLRHPYCLRPPLILLEDYSPVMIGLWDISAFGEHNAIEFFDFSDCEP
mmetsp:Transcript_21380/g.36016  ORF Transcript_21380/g.36016 Transcript_21380/m.36016 type:complete len:398 (-) Transcript_21380:178-1371(-)